MDGTSSDSQSLNDRIEAARVDGQQSENWPNQLDELSCKSYSTNPLALSNYINTNMSNSPYAQCVHAKPSIVEPIYEQFNP